MSEMPFEPFYQDDAVTIYNEDCKKVLPFLPKFDLLLTDPPYGLGKRLSGGSGEWKIHFDESPEWDKFLAPQWIIEQAVFLCRKSIIWGGNYYNLSSVRCWLAWDKMQEHTSGHFEMAWTTLDKPTRAFRMSRVEAHSKGKVHPTEKPIDLIRWCIGLSGDDVQSILDPFMGSGTTLVAAKLEGRKAVGIELDERYCESAVKRLEQGVLF